jgi:hypothetical protein
MPFFFVITTLRSRGRRKKCTYFHEPAVELNQRRTVSKEMELRQEEAGGDTGYWCRCFIAAAQRMIKNPIHKAAR